MRNVGKTKSSRVRALVGALIAPLVAMCSAGAATAVDPAVIPLGPARDPRKPTIVVIDAGGTLTSRARDRISYLHYSGRVEGGVRTILTDMFPELGAVANVSMVEVGGLGGSGAVTGEALYKVARAIDAQLARRDVDGVVVTAGTSVLEEDAYFFDLTVQSDKPVVVTGSMHQYGTLTYDAYTNLFSSIRLAASGKTTCFGTVALLNDQVLAARDVTKTDGFRMDTFKDRLAGPLGVVNEDHINLLRAPARVMQCGKASWKTPFDLSRITPDKLAPVEIAYGYVEASGSTIAGPVAAGAKGIVTAGFGPSDLSRAQAAARKEALDKGILFVAATRTGGEGTYDSTTPGLIAGGDLLPQKARLLLQLSLTFGSDKEQVVNWFNAIGPALFDMSKTKAATR